jgi:hypothetical protein
MQFGKVTGKIKCAAHARDEIAEHGQSSDIQTNASWGLMEGNIHMKPWCSMVQHPNSFSNILFFPLN